MNVILIQAVLLSRKEVYMTSRQPMGKREASDFQATNRKEGGFSSYSGPNKGCGFSLKKKKKLPGVGFPHPPVVCGLWGGGHQAGDGG